MLSYRSVQVLYLCLLIFSSTSRAQLHLANCFSPGSWNFICFTSLESPTFILKSLSRLNEFTFFFLKKKMVLYIPFRLFVCFFFHPAWQFLQAAYPVSKVVIVQ